jgi:hypothetical protein
LALALAGVVVVPLVLTWALWRWLPALVLAGALLAWVVLMAGSDWAASRTRWRPVLAGAGLGAIGVAVVTYFVGQFDASYFALLIGIIALRGWQQAGRLTDPQRRAMRMVGVGMLAVGAVAFVMALAGGTAGSHTATGAVFGFCLLGALSMASSFGRFWDGAQQGSR